MRRGDGCIRVLWSISSQGDTAILEVLLRAATARREGDLRALEGNVHTTRTHFGSLSPRE